MLYLYQEFGEGKWNENGKVRGSNYSEPLDPLPFPFFSPNPWSKHILRILNFCGFQSSIWIYIFVKRLELHGFQLTPNSGGEREMRWVGRQGICQITPILELFEILSFCYWNSMGDFPWFQILLSIRHPNIPDKFGTRIWNLSNPRIQMEPYIAWLENC